MQREEQLYILSVVKGNLLNDILSLNKQLSEKKKSLAEVNTEIEKLKEINT
jgi:hypothetical protein